MYIYMYVVSYFQEYLPGKHIHTELVNWVIAGDVAEYEVPQCPPGNP